MKKPSTGLNMLRVSATKKQFKTNFILHHHVHIYTVIIQKNIVILAMFFQNIFLSFTKAKTTVKLWEWDVYHSRVVLDVGGQQLFVSNHQWFATLRRWHCFSGWWQLKHFFYFHPYLGKWSNLANWFFRWVGEKPPSSFCFNQENTANKSANT